MTDDCFDDAFDALLAGRAVPAEAASLDVFVNGVQAVATRPGRPSPQLAEMLTGGLAAAPETGALPAVSVPPTARASRPTRRRRTVLAGLAAGFGLAFVGVTGAGAAGVLPDPIQGGVSGALEAVTPVEAADAVDDAPAVDDRRGAEQGDTGRAAPAVGTPAGAPAAEEFGGRVSEDAKGGGVDGPAVSSEARDRGRPDAPGRSTRPTSEEADTAGRPGAGPMDTGRGHP